MPHSDETFYKLKCGWAEDPKVASLRRFGPVEAIIARDLFSQMIDYARRNLSDGYVPAEEVGRLAYPLPADEADAAAMRLADPGAYGPLCESDATRNGWRILAYARWNDTAAEVQARKLNGREAALRRWKEPNATRKRPASRSHSGPHTHARAQVDAEPNAEQEQEQESPQSPPDASNAGRMAGRQPDDDDEQLSQVQALMAQAGRPVGREDAAKIRAAVLAKASSTVRSERAWIAKVLGDPRQARGYAPGAMQHAPTVQDIIAQTRRPGGPASDVPAAAAAARAQLLGRPRPDTPQQPPADDPTRGLHYEDLARAQLAEARAARQADQLPAAPAQDVPLPDDEPAADPEWDDADQPPPDDQEPPADDEFPF
jgi:hypothetical protein